MIGLLLSDVPSPGGLNFLLLYTKQAYTPIQELKCGMLSYFKSRNRKCNAHHSVQCRELC